MVCQTQVFIDLGVHPLGLGMNICLEKRGGQDSWKVAESGQEGLEGWWSEGN